MVKFLFFNFGKFIKKLGTPGVNGGFVKFTENSTSSARSDMSTIPFSTFSGGPSTTVPSASSEDQSTTTMSKNSVAPTSGSSSTTELSTSESYVSAGSTTTLSTESPSTTASTTYVSGSSSTIQSTIESTTRFTTSQNFPTTVFTTPPPTLSTTMFTTSLPSSTTGTTTVTPTHGGDQTTTVVNVKCTMLKLRNCTVSGDILNIGKKFQKKFWIVQTALCLSYQIGGQVKYFISIWISPKTLSFTQMWVAISNFKFLSINENWTKFQAAKLFGNFSGNGTITGGPFIFPARSKFSVKKFDGTLFVYNTAGT